MLRYERGSRNEQLLRSFAFQIFTPPTSSTGASVENDIKKR